MLPKQASEHYPVFLVDEAEFTEWTEDVYEGTLAELQSWREFYAKQFEDDAELEDYFANIKSIVEFETVLRAPEEATVDNLVKFKLVESAEALDTSGLPFPWKKSSSPTPPEIEKDTSATMDPTVSDATQKPRENEKDGTLEKDGT